MKQRRSASVPRLGSWPQLVALALSGFVLGIFGTYWDDAWHTEKGRDSFLIAPHLTLYLGISLGGGALVLWALLATRRCGWRRAITHPPLALALLGVVLTLVAAPIDNAWHLAFGRDAVIWSPPHMLGVAGSLAIAAGLLLELAPTRIGQGRRWQAWAARVAAAAVLAVCILPVLEYETDVPQFAPVFYLPVLATGMAFAFGLISRVIPGRWPATQAALVYMALMVVVASILLGADMPAPLLPLLVVPALGFDSSAQRLGLVARALGLALLLFAAYVPYLDWIKNDLFLDFSDLAVGLPAAALGAGAALWLTGEPKLPTRARALIGTTLLIMLLPAATALAHDPGQGEEIGTVSLQAAVSDGQATLEVTPDDPTLCASLVPKSTVARRGRETVRGALDQDDGCSFSGTVALPERGRWFVYANFVNHRQPAETWLPVHTADQSVREDNRSLYLPSQTTDPPVKAAAGVAVYLLLAATLIVIPILYRRQRYAWD